MNKTMTEEQRLINKYRKIMSTISDADKKTKALVLKMSMKSDHFDDAMIDDLINSLLEEQEAASDVL